MTETLDLLVLGGTIVTVAGSRPADIAVRGGRHQRRRGRSGDQAVTAREVIDATGMLVLPGVVDAHTHTRVASDASPDRFFQDSVAAAFGGTTTFLSFNNPGTGSSPAAERSLLTGLREWRAATDSDSAIDDGLSLSSAAGWTSRSRSCPPPSTPASRPRRRSWCSTSGCADRALYDAMSLMGRRGGMLQVHCEDPVLLDAAVATR